MSSFQVNIFNSLKILKDYIFKKLKFYTNDVRTRDTTEESYPPIV